MSTPRLEKHRNGHFYAVWSVGRRSRRKSMGAKDRPLAEARFIEWLRLGGHHEREDAAEKARLTVGDVWAAYDERHVAGVAAPDSLRYAWRALAPHFEDLDVADVDHRRVEAYLRLRTTGKLGRLVKPATVRKELVALRACLNWAADARRGLIDRAALQPFDLPPDAEPRDRWLSEAETARLLAAATPPEGQRMTRVERFVWLALFTLARKTAIRELTWSRVDFDVRMIHFAVPGRRRTKKRRVSVPISDAFLPILRRMKAEATTDFVLDHSGDGLWSAVQALAMRAGLAATQEVRRGEKPRATGISPHVFRHTGATLMARNGIDLRVVGNILGDSLVTTERTYAHHCPGRMMEAVNTIGVQK